MTNTGSPILCFAQSNPVGRGQGDVPWLLRRVDDTVEELGNLQVQDIVFQIEVTDGEDQLNMTVYYLEKARRT